MQLVEAGVRSFRPNVPWPEVVSRPRRSHRRASFGARVSGPEQALRSDQGRLLPPPRPRSTPRSDSTQCACGGSRSSGDREGAVSRRVPHATAADAGPTTCRHDQDSSSAGARPADASGAGCDLRRSVEVPSGALLVAARWARLVWRWVRARREVDELDLERGRSAQRSQPRGRRAVGSCRRRLPAPGAPLIRAEGALALLHLGEVTRNERVPIAVAG